MKSKPRQTSAPLYFWFSLQLSLINSYCQNHHLQQPPMENSPPIHYSRCHLPPRLQYFLEVLFYYFFPTPTYFYQRPQRPVRRKRIIKWILLEHPQGGFFLKPSHNPHHHTIKISASQKTTKYSNPLHKTTSIA